MDDDQKAVIVAAINLALARKRINSEGYAIDPVWDDIEHKLVRKRSTAFHG